MCFHLLSFLGPDGAVSLFFEISGGAVLNSILVNPT